MRVVVVQRVVPAYRQAVFQRLWDELGWVVATGAAPAGHGLAPVVGDPPWLHRFPIRRIAGGEYRVAMPMRRIAAALKPQAILAEFSLQMPSTYLLALARAAGRGVPVAFWSQGWNHERSTTLLVDRIIQRARLAVMARVDAQLCYSPAGADWLRARLPATVPAFVANNALDLGAMPGRMIDTSPRSSDAAQLLCLGRLTPDKRMPMVVEAFGRLLARRPRLHLTIVGDGPDAAAVAEAAKPFGDRITLAGAVYDANALAALFQRSSLLIVGGSAGLGVHHALAYHLPVVLFDDAEAMRHHPEHANVIDGQTGWRVPGPPTADALAAALDQLLTSDSAPRARLAVPLASHVATMGLEQMMRGFRALDDYFGLIATKVIPVL